MLKQLTDNFYRLSTEAEALLQRAITELHEEHAPSAEDTRRISTALAGLQAAYNEVRNCAAQRISSADMPAEGAPVSAYARIIDSKRLITEGILLDFLRAYANNSRYEDALTDAQEQARELLRVFREDVSSEPDVTPYKAFVDGIRMGDNLDSDEGDELLDVVETLSKKLARGLQHHHFSIREEELPDEELPKEEVCSEAPAPVCDAVADDATTEEKPSEPEPEPEPVPPVEEMLPEEPVQVSPAPIPEEEIVGSSEADDTVDAPAEEAEITPEAEFVYARNYKVNTTLPSPQKLLSAFNNPTASVVLYTIGRKTLVTADLIRAHLPQTSARFDPVSALDTLEAKGYLVSYEMDGTVYYCPSQRLINCTNSVERAKTLMSIRDRLYVSKLDPKKKKFPAPMLVGAEKIEKSTLLDFISWTKLYAQFFKLDFFINYQWDHDDEVYRVSGIDEAKDSLFTDVVCVPADRYAVWTAKEVPAVFSCGDVLPDAEEMRDVAATNCFFNTDKLYLWNGSEWELFDPTKPDDTQSDDNTPAEPETAPEEVEEPAAAEPEIPTDEIPEPIPEIQADEVPESVPEVKADVKDEAELPPVQPSETPVPAEPVVSPRPMTRSAGSAAQRDHYLSLAHRAYAESRRGVGSALLRALMQMHPEVGNEWKMWACASGDPAYAEGRNATKLQEIYPEVNSSSLADSALAVSAYIRMYFSNEAAKEYWVRSADTISSSPVLSRMDNLRELMQRLQDYVDANQHGINQATMVAMRQESGIEEQFIQLKAKASELVDARLNETTVSNPRVKDLFGLLFGNNSIMLSALQSICDDKRDEARQISARLEEISPDLIKNSQPAIESWIEFLWHNSSKKLKGKNANNNIVGSARNSAVNRTKNALGVINQWIELCIHNVELPETTIIAAAAEVKHLAQILPAAIREVSEYKATLRDDTAGYGALWILEDTLRYFHGLMNGESLADSGSVSNAEIAACDAMAVEEDGTVYIIPAGDTVMPYEQCDILAQLLEAPQISAEDAALQFVRNSMTNVNPTGGNFSNGRFLLGSIVKMYQPSLFPDYSDVDYASRIKDAAAIVAEADKKFHALMEKAQGYGWFTSYDEQERIEHAVAAQCEMYRIIDNFSACVACMERTYAWCCQSARAANHDKLMADLDNIVQTFSTEEDNATIVRIRKLIDQDCYSAATAEIRKIYKDNRVEDKQSTATGSTFDFFIQNFSTYFSAVQNVNEKLEQIFHIRNLHNRKGHIANGQEMLRVWPQSPGGLTPNNVKYMLARLNLDFDNVVISDKSTEGHVTVKFNPQKSTEYVHPIADFGTDMLKGGLDVFYLGGNRTADQYFDMIRTQIGKCTGHSAMFLVNSALSLSTRRQLTSRIWHELRSARPLIILDRVLALYVAENVKSERWNILLQCALPFAMVKPYKEQISAKQPPEMFVGRVAELRRLGFEPDSANLVYGGRQLGKTAILHRIEQELHDEAKSTYVVFCTIKDMDAAAAVRYILLAMRQKKVPKADSIPLDASWADMCFGITLIMTNHPEMKLMLLIDEADILLGRDKGTSYSALSEIKRVQDSFGERFRFVFAGLHNVMRLHTEALQNNSDLPKLGHINIKPLDYVDAEMLLKKPLSYLGFTFNDSEEQQALISMILSTTNYYPGLIHYYCASLLNTLSDGHTELAPTKPPYELDNKLILKLMQKKEFLEQTRQKFMMTLGIDKDEHQYYSILAYLMAYCYDENESQVNGVSVDEICDAATRTDIAVISRLKATQVEALLDELCELNILYCVHGSVPKRYVFSRPVFKNMLGTEDDIMEALLSYIGVEEVSQ